MTDRKWKTWEVIGLLVTLALGNLLHFVYEWSGDSPLTAPIAAVNESTWEHMKLLAVPWVLFSLVERAARGRSGGTVPMARALGLLAGLAAIPLLYYTCRGHPDLSGGGSARLLGELAGAAHGALDVPDGTDRGGAGAAGGADVLRGLDVPSAAPAALL